MSKHKKFLISEQSQIYQFRICLKGISPMILRRILIKSSMTLADLHYTIQIVMGWTDHHLNEFIIHGKKYTIPNCGGMPSPSGEYGTKIKLSDMEFRLNRKFLYNYDFTAGWEFEIRLEKVVSTDPKKTYPICISGSGVSPEEECGGPYYFNELKSINVSKSWETTINFIKALANKKNAKKKISEVYDIHQLREAYYWINIDKYERKDANKYLKFYANNDFRWQEAFDEVVYL